MLMDLRLHSDLQTSFIDSETILLGNNSITISFQCEFLCIIDINYLLEIDAPIPPQQDLQITSTSAMNILPKGKDIVSTSKRNSYFLLTSC